MGRALLLAVVLALAAAGCASLPPAQGARPERASVAGFQLEGRIAVRRSGESFSAGIAWRHGADSEEILLSGPLGQGLARLSADAAGAVLETADQGRYEARDLDSLMERVFGAPVPVAGMARWVLGRAAPGDAATFDASGRLARLDESGWVVEYLSYESAAAQALPVLLSARRDAVEVRLKIDSWSLAP